MSIYQPRMDWTVEYPPGIIKYNDMFRHKFLNYENLVKHLMPMYQNRKIERIADFGCGTGTLLFLFEEKGFKCFGYDRHAESVEIANTICQHRKSGVSFKVGDMLSAHECGQFDATVQAFVPISFISQATTLKSMRDTIRPGGLYSFMVVEIIGTSPQKDERTILNVVENNGCVVARIEPWKKNGTFIMWEPVLFVMDGGQFSMYIDHDELELYTEDTWQKLQTLIGDVGFRLIDIFPLSDSLSAPPWTLEKLVTVERLED